MKGVRPRDWDERLMQETLDTTEAEAFYILVQLYAWYWRVDQGDETGALEHLEKFLAAAGRSRSKALKTRRVIREQAPPVATTDQVRNGGEHEHGPRRQRDQHARPERAAGRANRR